MSFHIILMIITIIVTKIILVKVKQMERGVDCRSMMFNFCKLDFFYFISFMSKEYINGDNNCKIIIIIPNLEKKNETTHLFRWRFDCRNFWRQNWRLKRGSKCSGQWLLVCPFIHLSVFTPACLFTCPSFRLLIIFIFQLNALTVYNLYLSTQHLN